MPWLCMGYLDRSKAVLPKAEMRKGWMNMRDDLNAARGIVYGLMFGILTWVLIGGLLLGK